uniref:HD domain-containing protein n=1 Tax=Haemonchus contortus TaxID=6289 RepID=A0A7I4Y7X4_HAECO|nr:Metal-dependent phosphohydrolase domain containing protein [Haemonchus contortus]
MDRLLHWPPLSKKREIQDTVHGSISLFHPLELVIDTPEFQRLRDIKQLGVTYLVYPCSTHSRFVHSLGVYWLAFKFVEILKRDPSLNITAQDHLCVSLAALCHDLGHGPFSHLFDGAFQEAAKAPEDVMKHESISIELLRRIVKKKDIREALERYLGTGAKFDDNMTFTEELISSDRFDATYGTWLPRGRPVKKAFLYDIVANENDSCDVDKFDYLIRDSLSAGIPIPFNQRSIERLMENARVLLDPERRFPRICYAKKVADVVLSIGDSRQMLHNLLYQHRVVSAIEEMVVRALRRADRHLNYMDDNGCPHILSELSRKNLGAFLKTSDAILKDIANSSLPEMAEAQKILRDIEERNLPVKLDEVQCGSSWVDGPHAFFIGKAPKLRDVERLIRRWIQDELGGKTDEEEFMVLGRAMHRGLDGRSHPMSRVLLYDNKKDDNSVEYVDRKWLQLTAPEEAAIWTIRLYVVRSMSEPDRSQVMEAFDRIVTLIRLRPQRAQRVE